MLNQLFFENEILRAIGRERAHTLQQDVTSCRNSTGAEISAYIRIIYGHGVYVMSICNMWKCRAHREK